MPYYNCIKCNYNTKLRTDYTRHLITKKHKRTLINIDDKLKTQENDLIDLVKLTQNDPLLTQNDPLLTQNDLLLRSKTIKLEKNDYVCKYCNKTFTCNSHLTRHMKKNCKVKNEREFKEHSDDKTKIAKLENQISKLIDKVGNKTYHTHIGNTTKTENTLNMDNCVSNTNLNIFGKENLEMVTDEIKKELIKGPFKMMPKLLEIIYFNKEYPENHTMKLVNKNKEIMKVHKKEGWKLVDKTDTIDYIIEDKNYEVDNYYDNNTDEFSQFVKRTYKNFRRLFDNRDKELWKQIQRDVDLLLWNNM